MKRLLSISLSLLLLSAYAVAGDIIQKCYVVSVTTAGIQALPRTYPRKFATFKTDKNATVVLSSSNTINGGNYPTIGGYTLDATNNEFRDDFNVFQGTWYVTTQGIATSTATLYIIERY